MKLYTVIYKDKDEIWKVMKQFKDEMPAKLMVKNISKTYETQLIIADKMQRNGLVKI
jgi:hypothetical protein